MVNKKIGQQTWQFSSPPVILSTATIAGPMEGEGPLGERYDRVLEDNLGGQDTWEKCESAMIEWAVDTAVSKAGKTAADLELILAGDLLNQLMATHFAVRNLGRPFIGLYGACSTLAESTLLGAALLDGGFATMIATVVSSHHDTAERQYRFPTEQGVQRPPIAQWTVTGAGALVIAAGGSGPVITAATVGRVVDAGLKDPNEMGPAMAPAAADTLWRHLQDTGREPGYYDVIYTGDLGGVGKKMLIALMREKGVEIGDNYEDCGLLIYRGDQDTHSGASGCASSALVFCSHCYPQLVAGRLKKILIIGTGSLHSPTSYQQKETLPAIAHAVAVET